MFEKPFVAVWNGWYVSTLFCIMNFVLFPIAVGLLLLLVKSDPEATGQLATLPQQYQLTQMAFLTCLLLDFISWLWTVDKEKSRLFYLVLVINGLPVVTYGLLAAGYSPIWLDSHGRPLVVMRFLQWLFTTPAMLYLYSIVSSLSSRELFLAMALEYLVIFTGFFASVAPFPFDLVFLAICLVCSNDCVPLCPPKVTPVSPGVLLFRHGHPRADALARHRGQLPRRRLLPPRAAGVRRVATSPVSNRLRTRPGRALERGAPAGGVPGRSGRQEADPSARLKHGRGGGGGRGRGSS